MDVARSSDTHPSLEHSRQVGDDVPKQVRSDDDVEPLRVLDHPHATGIYVRVVRLDLGEILGHGCEGPGPDVLGTDGVGLVHQGDLSLVVSPLLFRPLPGELESVPGGPLTALPCVYAVDQGNLVRSSLLQVPPDLGVHALRVFPNHDEVDVLWLLPLQGTEMFGVQLDGSQIDVQVETEAKPENHGSLHQSRLHLRVSDGAQEEGIQRAPFIDDRIRHQLLGLQVVLTVVGIFYEFVPKALHVGNRLQDLEPFLHDIGPDPVSTQNSNLVGLHSDSLQLWLWRLPALASEALESYILPSCSAMASSSNRPARWHTPPDMSWG